MSEKNTLWYYLAMLPLAFAAVGAAVFGLLVATHAVADVKLLTVAAFAFAELTMIAAGFGGISYLINPIKTRQARRWVWLNVALFFGAAASGLALFMAL